MKMPDPIIDPTTMAVNAGRGIFWVGGAGAAGGPSTGVDAVGEDMVPSSSKVRTVRYSWPSEPGRQLNVGEA
jgi:hypothetical protein